MTRQEFEKVATFAGKKVSKVEEDNIDDVIRKITGK